jgi:hypothetical protein
LGIGLLRVLRVIVNSFALVVLAVLGAVTLQFNPLLATLFFLSALDQFEDVYYYVYGKRLVPRRLMPLDIVLELILVLVGAGMFVLSLIYYYFFSTWFFRALLPLSILIVYSALEDIAEWFKPGAVAGATKVVRGARLGEEIREEEEFRFIWRRH